MNIAGIDNGFSGAIAVLDGDGKILFLEDMPIIKAGKKVEINEAHVAAILKVHNVRHCFIEKAQSMPGQGISSTARYMTTYGLMRGIRSEEHTSELQSQR